MANPMAWFTGEIGRQSFVALDRGANPAFAYAIAVAVAPVQRSSWAVDDLGRCHSQGPGHLAREILRHPAESLPGADRGHCPVRLTDKR
jgi:hypothetical protein